MLMLRLLHYIFGYVVFEVYGFFTERFLNLVSRRKITLWGIKKSNNGKLIARVSVKEFKALREPAKKADVKIKITKKRGLPFIFYRYRKRKGIIIGLIIFSILLFLLSCFIWSVEINGNINVKSEDVIECLKESNINIGTLGMLCNLNSAKNNILNKYREIVWLDLSVKGSKLIVTIKEGVLPPSTIPKDKPCNIVAKKDGQITFIEAYEGMRILKKGDTVRKGELLVSGVLDSNTVGFRLVHSRASVKARTLTVIKQEIPLKFKENIKTGRFLKRYVLQFANFGVKLYIDNKIEFNEYTKESFKNELKLGKNIILPIRLNTDIFYETETKEREISENEAKIKAELKIYDLEKSEIFGTLLDRKLSFKTENETVFCEAEYICEEEISQEESIK